MFHVQIIRYGGIAMRYLLVCADSMPVGFNSVYFS